MTVIGAHILVSKYFFSTKSNDPWINGWFYAYGRKCTKWKTRKILQTTTIVSKGYSKTMFYWRIWALKRVMGLTHWNTLTVNPHWLQICLKDIPRAEKHVKYHMKKQPNSECGKFYGSNDQVASISRWHHHHQQWKGKGNCLSTDLASCGPQQSENIK